MEVDMQRNTQEDRMSECRSFGSNYQPSSQSRKISIGIMIDSLVKKGPGATKEVEVVVQNTEKGNSSKDNSAEGKSRGKEVLAANQGKQTDASEQSTSPWITTRSFHQKIPTSGSIQSGKGTFNSPTAGEKLKKQRKSKDVQVTHSVQFFTNQTPILNAGNDKQKINGYTDKRKEGNDGNPQTVQEFTFATAQEVHVSDKPVIEDKTEDGRTETLRMKLEEILGVVSSPRSQPYNPKPSEMGANNLNPDQILPQKDDAIVKPIHSDSIETDSENPDLKVKRPVTRSLTRRRASIKLQPEKSKARPSSSYAQKFRGKNVFSFADGLFGRGDTAVSGGSSMPKKKKGHKKSSGIEPRKICFSENKNAEEVQEALFGKLVLDHNGGSTISIKKKGQGKGSSIDLHKKIFYDNNADEIQVETHRRKASLPAEDQQASDRRETLPSKITSSLSHKMRNLHDCHAENTTKHPKPKNKDEERYSGQSLKADSHQSLEIRRIDQQGGINSPTVLENGDQRHECSGPSFRNVVSPQNDFQSPAFKIYSPIRIPSPVSTPKTDLIKEVMRRFTVENVHSFRTLQTPKADCQPSTAQTESSDDSAELKDSPPGKLSPLERKKSVEDDLSESSSDDEDSESFREDSPIIKGYREQDILSLETATVKRSKFLLRPTKRLHDQEGNVSSFSPTLLSPKGIGESDWVLEPSEQNQDELERVVTLFALALENFKNKLNLATRKKSSEILMSVSKEIHLQLQNIELQIQKDLGMLTSNSKLKRKRIEAKLQEHQEQLKLIHDKFRQDIHQHLQDCQNTLEGLEEHQIELKETMRKQKASHQKLFVQVEEAVETQLKDAERNVTAVQKLAREKMLQLGLLVAECLKDGVLR